VNSMNKSNAASPANFVFDARGRLQPSGQISGAAHAVSRHYFRMEEINFDPQSSYDSLAVGLNVALDKATFAARVDTMLEGMLSELGRSSVKNTVAVPFYLPKLDSTDLGTELQNKLLPAVSKSYNEMFPEYEFDVEYKGSIEGQLTSVEGLGHDRLQHAASQSDVLGVCLFALSEYSVQAAREQAALLPSSLGLTGALDLAAAFAARPDLLFNAKKYSPMIWMSGCETVWPHANFHFEAYGYNLTFNRRVHHELVAEYWHHGITTFEVV
jgi:hypothetical protein